MLKKKKLRLRTKRALLSAEPVYVKSVSCVRSRAKRVLHKRPLKGRSAWLKKKETCGTATPESKARKPVVPATPTDPNPDNAYSQGYNEAYNEGFNAGFAKGLEDGHQPAYKAQ